jgi:type VI secretion system protein ImpA
VDHEALLESIPGDVPHGVDLRNPARKPELYDALAAVRTARQRLEAQDPQSPPDWGTVEALCEAILLYHSKDMEAAALLTEALVYNHGCAGLAAGGSVIAGLIARWWDDLFPAPDPDDPGTGPDAARLQPLVRLVEDAKRLPAAIRRMVLFTLDDGTTFTLGDCQALKSWTALRPEERSKRAAGGLPPDHPAVRGKASGTRTWDELEPGLAADPGGALSVLRTDAASALVAWRAVAEAVQGRAGEAALACKPLLELIEDLDRLAAQLAPAAAQAAPAGESGLAAERVETASAATEQTSVIRAPNMREDALRQLAEIAAFFRRIEPHSPMAYTLEEAIRRARLTWPQWLAEVVPDRLQRDTILTRLGLRTDGEL